MASQKIISIISTKGGVGKTTLSASIAGCLHNKKQSILMIDADPQPSLSSYYKITKKSSSGLIEALQNPKAVNNCISQTTHGDLIYSNDAQNGLQHYLRDYPDGQFRIKQAIQNLAKSYDVIIIDTQGAKGMLQNAAILAATELLSPVLPEMTTVREFERGTLNMFADLQVFKDMGMDMVDNVKTVVYRMDRTINAKKYYQVLVNSQKSYPYSILNTQIPNSVVFDESAGSAIPVTELTNNKKQRQKAQKSIKAIEDLVKELGL